MSTPTDESNEPKVGERNETETLTESSSGDSSTDSGSSSETDGGSESTVSNKNPNGPDIEPNKSDLSNQSLNSDGAEEKDSGAADTTALFVTPCAKIAVKQSTKSKSSSPKKAAIKDEAVNSRASQSPIIVTPAKSMGPIHETPPMPPSESKLKCESSMQSGASRAKTTDPGVTGLIQLKTEPVDQSDMVATSKTVPEIPKKKRSEVKKECPDESEIEKKLRRKKRKIDKEIEANKQIDRRVAEKLADKLAKMAHKRKRVESGLKKAAKQKLAEAPASPLETPDGSESSPEQRPAPSRIAKIKGGRKHQMLAMARAKQLGSIRDNELQYREVMDGLKVIGNTKFNIDMSHAYEKFDQIPGTGLAHIQTHAKEIVDRYGLFLGSAADMHLNLAKDLHLAKKAATGPEASSKGVAVWQFNNDLQRTVPSTLGPLENASDESSESSEDEAESFKTSKGKEASNVCKSGGKAAKRKHSSPQDDSKSAKVTKSKSRKPSKE